MYQPLYLRLSHRILLSKRFTHYAYFQSVRNSSQNSGECLVDGESWGAGGPGVFPNDCTLPPPHTDTSPVTLGSVGKKGKAETPGFQKVALGGGVQVVSGSPSCRRPQEKSKLFSQERITKMILMPVCLFKT